MKVLHVDDSSEDRELIKYRLQKLDSDIEVEWAVNAQTALEKLSSSEFDCIISDYQMPTIDGLTFLKELRRTGNDTPFMFLTGQGSEGVAANAFKAGADDYFTKELELSHYERILNSIRNLSAAHKYITSTQRVRQKLQETEERFQLISENASDLIFAIDLYGNFVFMNKASRDFCGVGNERINNISIFNCLPEEKRDFFMKYFFSDIVEKRTLNHLEIEMISPLGEKILVEMNTSVIEKEEVTQGIFVIARDVTANKEFARKLKESNDKFRIFTEASKEGLIIHRKGKILHINSAMANMLGMHTSKLVGVNTLDIFPKNERSRVEQIIRTDFNEVYNSKVTRSDGSTFNAEIQGKCINSGKDTYRIAAVRDIDEKLSIIRELEELKQKYTLMKDFSHDSFFTIEENRIVFENHPSFLHENQSNNLNLNLFAEKQLSDETDQVSFLDSVSRLRSGKESELNKSFSFIDNGKVVTKGVTLQRLSSYSGEERIAGRISDSGISNDLLVFRNRAMKRKLAELERFNTAISHDLKTPVRQLESFCQIMELEAKAQNNTTIELLSGKIQKTALIMKTLMDDLIEYSQIAAKDFLPVKMNLSELIRRKVEEFSQTTPLRKIKLKCEDNIFAVADVQQMEIAFRNMIGNIWKFRHEDSETNIVFGRATIDKQQVFFLKDNGIGFAPEDEDLIFQPFARLHNRRLFEGTGIGLTKVKLIIEQHGGQIWAESVPNEGTTFFFTLNI